MSPTDRVAVATWSRRAIGACALIGVAILGLLLIGRNSDTAHLAAYGEAQPLSPTCLQWHEAAGSAVTPLVQSTRDVDLRQVGDAIFRMRRARRNCEAGWLAAACLDYRAVAGRASGHAGGSTITCAVSDDEPQRAVSQESAGQKH